jgi:PAP2 superfamily
MIVFYAFIGSVFILAASFARRTPDKYPDFCVAVGLLIFSILSTSAATLSGLFRPLTLDWYLFTIDRSFGLDGLTLARYAYGTPWLKSFLTVVYCGLPLAFATVWVLGKPSPVILRSSLFAAVAGCALYVLVPAVGPAHAFADFPWTAPQGFGWIHPLELRAARNCLPSLHFTWAMLLVWNCRGRAVRIFTIAFLFLTALATVAGGEHYFFDLIVSVPFCVAVQSAALRFQKVWTHDGPRETVRIREILIDRLDEMKGW